MQTHDQMEDSRHAEDSGVEVERFGRIFDSQHCLLHHEILHKVKQKL